MMLCHGNIKRFLIAGMMMAYSFSVVSHAQNVCDTDSVLDLPIENKKHTNVPKPAVAKKQSQLSRYKRTVPKNSGSALAGPVKFIAQEGDVGFYDSNGVVQSSFDNKGKSVAIKNGDSIKTSKQSFASVQMMDGSRLVIGSNSKVTLKHVSKSPVQIELKQGRIENYVTPSSQVSKNKAKTNYKVRTPAVTLSVRGTRFQVEHDQAANISRAGVSEGIVAAQSASVCGAPIILERNDGVLVDSQKIQKSVMLPSPNLEQVPSIIRGKSMQFSVPAVGKAQRYHAQLSYDAQFLMLVQEDFSEQPEFNFADLDSGYYFVKVSAIDSQGVEGTSATSNVLYQPDK